MRRPQPIPSAVWRPTGLGRALKQLGRNASINSEVAATTRSELLEWVREAPSGSQHFVDSPKANTAPESESGGVVQSWHPRPTSSDRHVFLSAVLSRSQPRRRSDAENGLAR